MGRVYIFNRNREHESSTVSVLLICQRTLIGALALLFYIARYKNLDYHRLVCVRVSASVRVCVSATIMMYFIWNGWAHAFASGASSLCCKCHGMQNLNANNGFFLTHTHTRFLRKIHADSLINLLFASQWMDGEHEHEMRVRKRKGLKSSVSNFLVAFCVCVVVVVSFLLRFIAHWNGIIEWYSRYYSKEIKKQFVKVRRWLVVSSISKQPLGMVYYVCVHVGIKILIFTKADLPESTGRPMQGKRKREWVRRTKPLSHTSIAIKKVIKTEQQNEEKIGVIASYY